MVTPVQSGLAGCIEAQHACLNWALPEIAHRPGFTVELVSLVA
jgi:hypothetical protein